MPEIIQRGDINRGIKPGPLALDLESNQIYFNYGSHKIPCRCRLETPVEPDLILDYLSGLNFDQIQVPHLAPGVYQVGFSRTTINQSIIIQVAVINRLSSGVSPSAP